MSFSIDNNISASVGMMSTWTLANHTDNVWRNEGRFILSLKLNHLTWTSEFVSRFPQSEPNYIVAKHKRYTNHMKGGEFKPGWSSFSTSILGWTIVCALVANTSNGGFGGAISIFTCSFSVFVTLIFSGRCFLLVFFVWASFSSSLLSSFCPLYRSHLLSHAVVFGDLWLRIAQN